MEKYIIEFYREKDGTEPAKEFIESLEPKMLAKVLKIFDLLEINGPQLRMPYSEYLRDGIFEIRAKHGTDITRILYFFVIGKRIILSNGFVKKDNKIPRMEIERAIKHKIDYERGSDNDKL